MKGKDCTCRIYCELCRYLMIVSINELFACKNDCNGCYTTAGAANIQKVPYNIMSVFKLTNGNIVWSFLLILSLVLVFGLRKFIQSTCMRICKYMYGFFCHCVLHVYVHLLVLVFCAWWFHYPGRLL